MMIRRTAPVVALAAAALAAPAAHAADLKAARAAASYLAGAQRPGGDGMAADTLVALRGAGTLSKADAGRRAAALRNGAKTYATTAGSTGKTILALVASGAGNPRCAAGGLDLFGRLQHFGHAGRYGTTIFDQTLGMLAVHALHAGPSRNAVSVLLNARGRDGWNFNLTRSGGRPDDVTSTAMAILAARASGVSANDGTLKAGLSWMLRQRTAAGGFALGRRDRNEANSTALAIEAEAAMGRRDSAAERALRTLQRPGGAFQYTRDDAGSRVLASVDSVIALSGRRLPVSVLTRRPGGC